MSQSKNIIRWFESATLDKPGLRSPQPCKRGIHCDYKLKDEASGELVRACCSGVHPGEEGTGRRLFPARQVKITGAEAEFYEQPECVRLTGASQGFYERRRLRLSWAEWCEKKGIPFTPALPGQPFEPLVRAPLGGKKVREQQQNQSQITAETADIKVMLERQKLDMFTRAEQRSLSRPPSPLIFSTDSTIFRQRWAVSARGGECSPDCCCPTGISCHDRNPPQFKSGSVTPTFDTSHDDIDFEAMD